VRALVQQLNRLFRAGSCGSTDLFSGTPIVPAGLAISTYAEYQMSIEVTSDSTVLSFTGLTSNDAGACGISAMSRSRRT